MARSFNCAIFLTCASLAFGCSDHARPVWRTITGDLVLRNVTIIDGSGAPGVPNQSLLIRDGRIQKITSPHDLIHLEGTEVLDLSGKTVIPGLIDMHAHLIVEERDADGTILPKWDRESTLEMLPTLLDFGVTTVRDPGAPTETAVVLRDAVNRGDLTGPRIFTAGRILLQQPFVSDAFVEIRTPEEIEREVDWQRRAGVDFIKVYSQMPPELLAHTIRLAHERGLKVIGHLGATTWGQAAELGIDGIEHPASWSAQELPEQARAGHKTSLFGRVGWIRDLDLSSEQTRLTARSLVENGVFVDPTLMAMHTKLFGNSPRYLQNPDNRFAPPKLARNWPRASFTSQWTDADYQAGQAQWPKLLEWIRLLHESGVRLTVGTDSPTPWIVPGAAVHDEMRLLADAGIPPLEIVRMATRNAAIALGRENDLGLIRDGYVADLIVLNEDPSYDIRNTRSILMVISRGRVWSPRQ